MCFSASDRAASAAGRTPLCQGRSGADRFLFKACLPHVCPAMGHTGTAPPPGCCQGLLLAAQAAAGCCLRVQAAACWCSLLPASACWCTSWCRLLTTGACCPGVYLHALARLQTRWGMSVRVCRCGRGLYVHLHKCEGMQTPDGSEHK